MTEPNPNKIVDRLDNQKETLKMAEFFSKQELTTFEKITGILSALIIYGTGFGFLIYILFTL